MVQLCFVKVLYLRYHDSEPSPNVDRLFYDSNSEGHSLQSGGSRSAAVGVDRIRRTSLDLIVVLHD